MHYYLQPHQHAAFWGEDVIFFDANNGRYQLAAGLGRQVQATSSLNILAVDDTATAETLVAADILSPKPTLAQRRLPDRPSLSALEQGAPERPSNAWGVLRAYADMPVLFAGRSLPFLFAHARAVPSRNRPGSPIHLARTFQSLSPWLPVQGACVFRSFMLMRLLSRAGANDLHWVFGVRTWPFHAHCWVQRGDVALSDYPEALIRYSPIFAA